MVSFDEETPTLKVKKDTTGVPSYLTQGLPHQVRRSSKQIFWPRNLDCAAQVPSTYSITAIFAVNSCFDGTNNQKKKKHNATIIYIAA